MKLELTKNQIDTILEAIDFWQGSLIGIDDYKAEYSKAVRIEKALLAKITK